MHIKLLPTDNRFTVFYLEFKAQCHLYQWRKQSFVLCVYMCLCVWMCGCACSVSGWKGAVASLSEDHSSGQLFAIAFPVYVIMHENASNCSNKEK